MSALDLLQKRLAYEGGGAQRSRMEKDKYKALQKAYLYSYQSANIRKLNEPDKVYKALMNPNKLKPDYDDKVISTNYENGFKPGDIFEWIKEDSSQNSYWIIYLQELTETAYFRGDVRKCSFEIKWKQGQEEKSTWAAIRGPVETDIKSIQKNNINIDVPNHSLHILMPRNEDTLSYFKRYAQFYLYIKDMKEPTCWRVEATDAISTPGVLELTAEEYFVNEKLEQEEPIPPEPVTDIIGEHIIKPHKTYTYEMDAKAAGSWTVEPDVPVELIPYEDEALGAIPNKIKLKWLKTYSGKFNLSYGESVKEIIVESLF